MYFPQIAISPGCQRMVRLQIRLAAIREELFCPGDMGFERFHVVGHGGGANSLATTQAVARRLSSA